MQGGSERARRTHAFIRDKITTGEWPVNAKIPTEPQLMELLGVGKTTVREAVRSLASIGMLEPMPGIGTFVRSRMPVSTVLADYLAGFDVADLLGYRRALEREAAQEAAARATPEQLAGLRAALAAEQRPDDAPRPVERGRAPGQLHFLLVEASGNALLASQYAGVVNALRRATSLGLVGSGLDAEARLRDHADLVSRVAAGDVVGAAHAMAAHVDLDLVVVSAAQRPGESSA